MASRAGGHGDRCDRCRGEWKSRNSEKPEGLVAVNSLKLKKSQLAIGLVVGLVLGASSPASPAPALSNIAALKTPATSDVVTVLCRNSATARTHSCYDRHGNHMAKIDVVAPAYGNQGGGCFIVTDRTRGFRHWSPSC